MYYAKHYSGAVEILSIPVAAATDSASSAASCASLQNVPPLASATDSACAFQNMSLGSTMPVSDNIRMCLLCCRLVIKGKGGMIRTALARQDDYVPVILFMCHTCYFTETDSVFDRGWFWIDMYKIRYDPLVNSWTLGWRNNTLASTSVNLVEVPLPKDALIPANQPSEPDSDDCQE